MHWLRQTGARQLAIRNPDDRRVKHLLTAIKPVRHDPLSAGNWFAGDSMVVPDDVLNCEIAGIVDESDRANVAPRALGWGASATAAATQFVTAIQDSFVALANELLASGIRLGAAPYRSR